MTIFQQIVIPAVTALLGFLLGNWEKILGYKRKAHSEELDIGEKLMKAINDGRDEILEAYKIIKQMELENRNLVRENIQLVTERDTFKTLAEQLKGRLDKLTKDFDECAEQAKRYLPNIQNKENEDDKTERPYS
jgi:hypothetical protein